MAISRPRQYGSNNPWLDDEAALGGSSSPWLSNRPAISSGPTYGPPNPRKTPKKSGSKSVNRSFSPSGSGRTGPGMPDWLRRLLGIGIISRTPRDMSGGGSFGKPAGKSINLPPGYMDNLRRRQNQKVPIEANSVGQFADLTPPPGFGRDLQSYLSQALGLVPGIGDGGWDARREEARRQAAIADAKLKAMYAQLTESLRGDIPALNEATSAALDDIDARSASDQELMQQARDANREAEAISQENRQLADSKLLQESRGRADADATFNQDQMIEGGANQRAYTRNMSDASSDLIRGNIATSGLEGAERRAANQANLAALLAALSDEEQQWRNNAQQQRAAQALSLANQMYNTDYGRFTDRQNYLLGLDDRAYDRAWQQDQAARAAAIDNRDYNSAMYQMALEMAQNQDEGPQGLTSAEASVINNLMKNDKNLTYSEALRMVRSY